MGGGGEVCEEKKPFPYLLSPHPHQLNKAIWLADLLKNYQLFSS
jgi:hypothetical protein